MPLPMAKDMGMVGALKKASAEAKQTAAADGVPFIGGIMTMFSVPK